MSDAITVPTTAIADADGVRSLTRAVEPPEEVTDTNVRDPRWMVRFAMRVLRDLAALRRRFAPRRIDFEDRVIGTGTYEHFPHGFGGRVRWWVVDVQGSFAELVRLDPDTESDENTLVLYSGQATLVTVRVEEVGG